MKPKLGLAMLGIACVALPGLSRALAQQAANAYLSPAALVAHPSGKSLYVACATANRISVFDVATRKVTGSFAVPDPPLGLAVSREGTRLFVTCSAPKSTVLVLDSSTGQVLSRVATGHTAAAPVLSPDESTLFVCCRFNDSVAVVDVAGQREITRIPVRRQPSAAAITRDGRFLLVANLLPAGRADQDFSAAVVSVIDCASRKVLKEVQLPNGSGQLNGLGISPDGRYAVVTHIVGRYQLPASQLERGWINTNAKTIIDLERLQILNTVLLDGAEAGAANPWGIAWSADGNALVVTHAGTHELSVVDFPGLVQALVRHSAPETRAPGATPAPKLTPVAYQDVLREPINDFAFLAPFRTRVKLPAGELGPRSVVVLGQQAFVANYFSDSISITELTPPHRSASVALGSRLEPNQVRLGERYFHDATICFQGWQSCSSCHPGDARVDGLNWDLLNDGVGNPKNNKSLLLAHKTPPSMSLGVRESSEAAVRAGIRSVLFTVQPASVSRSIDAYLQSLKPVPSPLLLNGELSPAAKRGERVFNRSGCAPCHPPGLFTNLESYDVGTNAETDNADDRFDTPTLIEIWRTAPYLHDGSAATIRDVLTTRNRQDRHGSTSKLSPQELDDLCEYLLSL